MAFILNDPILGVLGDLLAVSVETICEDRGQGLTLDWTQSGLDQDFEHFGYTVRLAPAEEVPFDAQVSDNVIIRTAYGTGLYGAGPYSGLSGGNSFGVFILDVSTLGSLVVSLTDVPIQDRGRSIQLDWSQGDLDQDLEIFGYAILFAPAEQHAMEPS